MDRPITADEISRWQSLVGKNVKLEWDEEDSESRVCRVVKIDAENEIVYLSSTVDLDDGKPYEQGFIAFMCDVKSFEEAR